MKAIKEKDWRPADSITLEDNADSVVRDTTESVLVVAGPGAGKTELLAQRACFLLETNACRFPHRILAISFKRDAAYNLKDRVILRAGDELSRRFDSLTYDSFAKQILDRFKSALPSQFQIPDEYDIVFDQDIIDIYRKLDATYVATNNTREIASAFMDLKLSEKDPDQLRSQVKEQAVKSGKLTFKMVMRLADLLIETNPTIKLYLQTTYQYVFLDEFQDTTVIQYEFLKTCFLGSDSTLTAVGDDKQRIMVWAGALRTIFEDFLSDNNGRRVPLTMNFRSAPILVEVQNSLIKHLLNKTDFATASSKFQAGEGECLLWQFRNQTDETNQLVTALSQWIRKERLDPRDICVLVKRELDKYVRELIDALALKNLNARDEGVFQDFLTDELTLYLLHCLYLIVGTPRAESRSTVFSFLSRVNNEMSESQLLKMEHKVSSFVARLKKGFSTKLTKKSLNDILHEIVDFAGQSRIQSLLPQYRQRGNLTRVLGEFEATLWTYLDKAESNQQALDQFYGIDTIPVMTVHKSKGLEYHTVVFVGLEDGAFFSFARQPDEDKSTFFVALSRAKMRVVFTFSKLRSGLRFPVQKKESIAVIFDELQRAGAVLTEF